MTDSLRFNTQWWAWWSNPIRGIHPEQLGLLPLTSQQIQKMDYFELLQLRSLLALPDMPDENIQDKLQLRSVAIASRSQLEKHCMKWAVWGMDSSILHARAQDWEANYGINSPEVIREIVSLRNEMPHSIFVWHDTFSSQLKILTAQPLLVTDRALLSMAIYLKSFFPNFYARWKLTVPLAISGLASKLESIPIDLWEPIDALTSPGLDNLHREVYAPHEQESAQLPELENMAELDDYDMPSDLIGRVDHA